MTCSISFGISHNLGSFEHLIFIVYFKIFRDFILEYFIHIISTIYLIPLTPPVPPSIISCLTFFVTHTYMCTYMCT